MEKNKKEEKSMSWQYTIIIITLILGIFAIMIALLISPISFEAKCDIKGIEYTNVCPAECWNEKIFCEKCPLPKDLSCDLNAKAPILKLITLFT
jgi:hypothetical protein